MWQVMGQLLFRLLKNVPKRVSFLVHSRVSDFLLGFESMEITKTIILLHSSCQRADRKKRSSQNSLNLLSQVVHGQVINCLKGH